MQCVVLLRGVFDNHACQFFIGGNFSQYRRQIQESIGYVIRQNSVPRNLPHEGAHGLLRDQMHRDGIAGKRIDREHVELIVRLALQRQTGITQNHTHLRFAIGQVGEMFACEALDFDVDFIDAADVTFATIRGHCAHTQADHADALRVVGLWR